MGAGPGDPGLLTARALELIARADTVLYDRLIPPQALAGARPDAELLFVGKQGGGESVPQEQTEALMIERARAGREVVRLKGGDPFVFGRGGEEAWRAEGGRHRFSGGARCDGRCGRRGLRRHPGHPPGPVKRCRVRDWPHPGGHPLGFARTGRGKRGGQRRRARRSRGAEPELDWQALAAFPGTLVFYMGVRALQRIADSLIAAGRPASQPVALVERGTLPDQRTVSGTLATIAELAAREDVKAPAISSWGTWRT